MQCLGWQLLGDRWFGVEERLTNRSVWMVFLSSMTVVSRKGMLSVECSDVKLIDRWNWLINTRKLSSSEVVTMNVDGHKSVIAQNLRYIQYNRKISFNFLT